MQEFVEEEIDFNISYFLEDLKKTIIVSILAGNDPFVGVQLDLTQNSALDFFGWNYCIVDGRYLKLFSYDKIIATIHLSNMITCMNKTYSNKVKKYNWKKEGF